MDETRSSSANRPRSLAPGEAASCPLSDPTPSALGKLEQDPEIPRPHNPRTPVEPWLQREPIPQSIKEELIRKAEAERAAFIQDVLAAPRRTLWRLVRSPKPAIGERNARLLGSDHDRGLCEARVDREQARGLLPAAVFALPNVILGRRRASSVEPAAATEAADIPSPATDQSGETRRRARSLSLGLAAQGNR